MSRSADSLRSLRVELGSLVLTLTLVPVAGAVDLCNCDALGHGLFCAAPAAAPSCCAPAPAEEDGLHAEGDCGCPTLQLAEADPRTAAPVSVDPPAPTAALGTPTWTARPLRDVGRPPVPAARPPPPSRLHLLLCVQRC